MIWSPRQNILCSADGGKSSETMKAVFQEREFATAENRNIHVLVLHAQIMPTFNSSIRWKLDGDGFVRAVSGC